MIQENNSQFKTSSLPSHTCGRGVGGEGVLELPGVARRLVTFFCFAKKKVTKEKATPIRHLFEVPCVARQLRRLRNSHDPLRGHVLKQSSPTTPELSPLLGGGKGEGKAKRKPWIVKKSIPFSYVCEGFL